MKKIIFHYFLKTIALGDRIVLYYKSRRKMETKTKWSCGEVGVHAGLSHRRSRVRVPSAPPFYL
ncbi:hypothetical protein EMIT07CA2_20425 [Brevibacillus sp. IT-7CA2]